MGQHDLSYRLFFQQQSMIRDLLVEMVGEPWVGCIDFTTGEQLRFLLVEQRLFSPERLAPLRSPVALLFRIENSRDWRDLPGNVELLRQTVTDPFLREAFESWLQKVILPRFGISEEASAQLSLKEMETMLAERIDQWNREIREEGRQEGEARVLLLLLRLKFGPLSPESEEQVREADSDRLLEWTERILTAERLEDVFAPARG